MKKERSDYLDATKGIAILSIALLHVEDGVFPIWLNTWIGLFMITTFYFTSGWISYGKELPVSVKTFFLKRIRQLGKPYIGFSLLIILFELVWISLGFMDIEVLYRDIYKTITLRGIGTLWFLPVLLFAEVLFLFIRSSKHYMRYSFIFFCLTLAVPYVYYTYWTPKLESHTYFRLIDSPIRPFVQTLTAWPIIAAGYIFARFALPLITDFKNYKKIFIGIIIIIISILFTTVPPFELYFVNGFIANILPAIGFALFFWGLKDLFYPRFFIYWGKNSLILMATHYSITQVMIQTFDRELLGYEIFSGPRTLIYFVVIVLLTYPWVYLFNHHLRFLLGRK